MATNCIIQKEALGILRPIRFLNMRMYLPLPIRGAFLPEGNPV
jgi:hypothetical protein